MDDGEILGESTAGRHHDYLENWGLQDFIAIKCEFPGERGQRRSYGGGRQRSCSGGRWVTWICPSGTHGLVYRVWPIKEVGKYKDSKINLETKKEGSNPYSTRTLVKP
jgi:hypothetical protein